MQSEETVAIRQHLQTTDADNFDVHVEEYIIQEHNDDQISSDGTVLHNATQAPLSQLERGHQKRRRRRFTRTL